MSLAKLSTISLTPQYLRHTLTLASGTALSQLIPIAASPILSRMYGPAEFATFAIFSALASILVIVATGRYELAILIPKRNTFAVHLYYLAICCAAAFSLLALIIGLINPFQLEMLSRATVHLLPLAIFLNAFHQASYYLLNRQRKYKAVASIKVLQSGVFALGALTLGYITPRGESLIIALVAANAVACLALAAIIFTFPAVTREYPPTRATALAVAHRFHNFPRILIFAHLINVGSLRLPTLLLAPFFGGVPVGLYSLTQQILSLPSLVIAGAVGDVFRQQASALYAQTGGCRALYLQTLIGLTAIAAGPALIIIAFAPDLFELTFGEQWRDAGNYAQLLAPMFFAQFVASPLSCMFMIAEKQSADFLWQIVLLTGTASALVLGWLVGSVYLALALFSSVYTFMYLVNIVATYRFAGGQSFGVTSWR